MTTTCQKEPKVSQKELVQQFAEALANYRVDEIASLLAEDGEFNYSQIDGDEVEDATKAQYLEYLKSACEPMMFTASEPASISYDQCMYCKFGNPVVLLNDGTFPYHSANGWEKERIGLMLEFKDGKVSGVTECASFLKTDNEFRFLKNANAILEDMEYEPLTKEESESRLKDSSDDPESIF